MNPKAPHPVIGTLIQARLDAGRSVADVARALGLSPAAIHARENGRRDPSLGETARWATELDREIYAASTVARLGPPARSHTAAIRHTGCGHVIAMAPCHGDLLELADALFESDCAWELVEEMPTDDAITAYREGPCDTCKAPS